VLWLTAPLFAPILPPDTLNDGTIALLGVTLLFVIPDGTGRPLLTWREANRAPWDILIIAGGGLALAAAISSSGLGTWVADALSPVAGAPLLVVALLIVGVVVIFTEFASNVASASAVIPVIVGLVLATGADPVLLAMPAAIAASWAFMMPTATGPNMVAWATGHVAMPKLVKIGICMNLIAPPLIVGMVWAIWLVAR
jgi:solute carrier family 13 (sodium-dependent dicarboxylate transporter), member 2/3/5